MDLRSQILDLLNEDINDDLEDNNSEDSIKFDKEKYNELYDKINELVYNIMTSSYSTLFLSEKMNENYDLTSILNITSSNKVLEYAKVFVNLYWQEINQEKETQVIIQINNILSLDILKNNREIFSLLKSTCLYVMMIISRTVFDDVDNYDKFCNKLFNMIRALLEINKITCLDDEDDIEGIQDDISNNTDEELQNNIFWL